jgi:hypothetical protein
MSGTKEGGVYKKSVIHLASMLKVRGSNLAQDTLFIIIIIIIRKDTVSFMQGIYTYISETNHVPKE